MHPGYIGDVAGNSSAGPPTVGVARKGLGFVPLVAFALMAIAASASGAEPGISEFMASNTATLADDDGAFSDWIEIHNPNPTPHDLGGWYLTDTATNKTKWQFPSVNVPAGGFLIVWASNKNRRDPAKPLHTNFALSAGGEYLGLIKPDGVTVVSEFAPTYPPQRDDTSYGISQASGREGDIGFFSQASPGRTNGAAARSSIVEQVAFSRSSGPFRDGFTLQLSGAGTGQRIRYVIAGPSISGPNLPVPSSDSPEYVAPLAIRSSVVIRAAVFANDSATSGPATTAHYVLLDPGTAAFTSQLPVLVLDNHGIGPLRAKDGIDYPTWLYAYAPRGPGVSTFVTEPDVATPLTSTIRGQSASEFPKKSYNLKFTDVLGAKHPQALFGSAAYEKWALIAPWFYDRTFISNATAYALSNRIGQWAPRTHLVEVYFNTGTRLDAAAYYGVCVLTDRIEVAPGRVEITPLTGSDTSGAAVTGGYIVKIDTKDDDEFAFVTNHGVPQDVDSMVVVAYPKDADLAPAQRTYIQEYIQAMEDTLYADQASGWATHAYLDYIDRPSWVDHHILNSLAANPDAFRRSSYFTKDRNGRLKAGPLWDFDRAFDSIDLRNVGWGGWRGEYRDNSTLWDINWWGILSRDPEFMQEWIDRWQNLRRGEFADANLTALIDSLAAKIGPEAAARDAARWPDDASMFGDYGGEIRQMKAWLIRRADWIDRQFIAAPVVAPEGDILKITPAFGAQLVYTLDGSDPRSVGGNVAPNAIVSAETISVPASANLHARSYSEGAVGGFPGTPWSSAVGTENSTPLSPVARLVNISARSMVGPGDDALVANLVVSDSNAKRILARAVGPSLAPLCPSTVVPDPQLLLVAASGAEIGRNQGWDSGADAAQLPLLFRSVGAFPLSTGSGDAAMLATLRPGGYTLSITSPTNRSGLALAEVYELDTNGRGLGVSIHGLVRSDDGVLVAGFVVQGPAYGRLLVRANAAPRAGTTGAALGGIVLSLYRGGELIATNERWPAAANAAEIEAASRALGVFSPAGGSAEDAAIFATLPPGPYTVLVHGKDGGEGVATLAIHGVP